jgi:hypothetical protein
MPSKKIPTKPAAKRKHRPSRPKPIGPTPANSPSASPASPAPLALREPHANPPAPVLDARKLLLQAKRYRLRRSDRLGDAFRRIGLDENAIAAGYADALAKLQRGNADDSVEKYLLDVLKECARILEPPRPADRSASIDVNTVVQLVHKVDRPLRQLPERPQAAEPPVESEPLITAATEPIATTEPCVDAEPSASQLL